MRISSSAKADLIFPGHELVRPGETIEVADAYMDHPVVAGWIESGLLAFAEEEAAPVAEKPARRKKGEADEAKD